MGIIEVIRDAEKVMKANGLTFATIWKTGELYGFNFDDKPIGYTYKENAVKRTVIKRIEMRYQVKDTRLRSALNKVRTRLQQYKDTPDQEHKDWNDWHDLEDRIEARIKDNYFNYLQEQFRVNGWVAL